MAMKVSLPHRATSPRADLRLLPHETTPPRHGGAENERYKRPCSVRRSILVARTPRRRTTEVWSATGSTTAQRYPASILLRRLLPLLGTVVTEDTTTIVLRHVHSFVLTCDGGFVLDDLTFGR